MIGRAPDDDHAALSIVQPPMQTLSRSAAEAIPCCSSSGSRPRCSSLRGNSLRSSRKSGPCRWQPLATAQPILARGKPYEEPPPLPILPAPAPVQPVSPAPLSLPSPAALGVAPTARPAPTAAQVDWNAVHERMQRLGSVGVQSVPLSDGRHRVALTLPTNQVDQVHHVEAIAATEAEAVTAALVNAEEWSFSRR